MYKTCNQVPLLLLLSYASTPNKIALLLKHRFSWDMSASTEANEVCGDAKTKNQSRPDIDLDACLDVAITCAKGAGELIRKTFRK